MMVYRKGNRYIMNVSYWDGGYVLIRLGNDESLGRELRAYLETEKDRLGEALAHIQPL